MIPSPRDRHGAAGQILVLMAGGMIAVIVVVALIVDGGNVWAQQRVVQNGSDGSAEAGAIVMAQQLAGVTAPVLGWDHEIDTQVHNTALANGITVSAAYYTDICGIPLKQDGTAALNPDGTEDLLSAMQVGTGSQPTSSATTPDCPSLTVGPPAGVLVLGHKDVGTFVAGVIGMTGVPVTTRATAVAGYLQGFCDATQGSACKVLPVAMPVNVTTCNGQNRPVDTGNPWQKYVIYKIPLCSNDPGNVGWLDWDPPGGGASELVCSILQPDNPSIDLPSWQYVTQTGNTNGGGGQCGMSVEEAIRTYDGKIVMIPEFDLTCAPPNNVTPDSSKPAVETPNLFGCPGAQYLGGNGNNQWYRMPAFAFIRLCSPTMTGCGGLHGAYISGSNGAECDSGGNGATSCLIGEYVDILSTGTVGPGVGGGTSGVKALGVQLIK